MQGRKFLPGLPASSSQVIPDISKPSLEKHLDCGGNKSTLEKFSYDDCELKVHSALLIHQKISLGLSPASAAHPD